MCPNANIVCRWISCLSPVLTFLSAGRLCRSFSWVMQQKFLLVPWILGLECYEAMRQAIVLEDPPSPLIRGKLLPHENLMLETVRGFFSILTPVPRNKPHATCQTDDLDEFRCSCGTDRRCNCSNSTRESHEMEL